MCSLKLVLLFGEWDERERTRCFKFFSALFVVAASWMNEYGRWKLRLWDGAAHAAKDLVAAVPAIVSQTRRNTCSAPCAWCKCLRSSDNQNRDRRRKMFSQKKTNGKNCVGSGHGKMCSKTRNFVSTNRTAKNFRSEFSSVLPFALSSGHFLLRRSHLLTRVQHFRRWIVLSSLCSAAPNTQIVASQSQSFFRISWCIASHLTAQSHPITLSARSVVVDVAVDQVFYFVPIIGSIPQLLEKSKETKTQMPAHADHLNRTNERKKSNYIENRKIESFLAKRWRCFFDSPFFHLLSSSSGCFLKSRNVRMHRAGVKIVVCNRI